MACSRIRTAAVIAAAIGLFGSAGSAVAVPTITYNFDIGANTNLGTTYNYTVPSPTLKAFGGSFSGSSVTLSSDLFSNDHGTDEQGLGICSDPHGQSNTCSDSTEINGSELVQLDLQSLYGAGYNSFSINADSATDGELLDVYVSTSPGSLGTLVAQLTSAEGTVAINTGGARYVNFTSGSMAGSNDVLLHSLTASVPEPATMALLGAGFVGLGLLRRRSAAPKQ